MADNFKADSQTLLEDILARAKRAGADAADASYGQSIAVSHSQRMGQPEEVERSESTALGLRVFLGQRQAHVSGNNTSPAALDELVSRALSMAKFVPEDSYCGLASPDQLGDIKTAINLDMIDEDEPDDAALIERARACEQAALAFDEIKNSEGAGASWQKSKGALMTSNGFFNHVARTTHSLSAHVIAGEGLNMEGDYDYASKTHGADLPSPAQIGSTAAKRAIARLNPKKPKAGQVPILFDKRVATSLLGAFAGAINGKSIAKGTSFLMDKLDKQIFASGVNIIDDPRRKRGLASRCFDSEGIATAPMNFIEDGVLKSWLLDLATARQLGFDSTGHARRSGAAPPSPGVSNFYLQAGDKAPLDLVRADQSAFLVTHLMGMGVNQVTGDYSQGASGFWLEKGEIAFPVNEATIAGNLLDMFMQLTPANDLEFKGAISAPSLRIDSMTIGA